MFRELIINGIPELFNFFKQLNLNFYFSKPQIRHLQSFIVAMMLRGYCGKLSNVSDLALNTHRSSISRFLDSDSWDETYLLRQMQKHVIERIWNKSKQTGAPIHVIIDDTICVKTVPSSKVKQPISGCGFHQSHLQNKTVYGHQFVSVMIQCGELILPYDTILYQKDKLSKIQIAKQVILSLPKPINAGYILSDSWYSCHELFEAAVSAGYHYIGALKSNRKIFPKGYRKKGIQVGKFAHSRKLSEFDLVTIKGKAYYIYTYLGKVKGMRKVKIVISWPVADVFIPNAMKAFISTDIKMSGKQLLNHYTKRWPIEVFFRESKRYLGMKQCQVRSPKAVIRFQYIVLLGYLFCGLEVQGESLGFSKKRSIYQQLVKKFQINWVYSCAQNHVELDKIFKEFHLA